MINEEDHLRLQVIRPGLDLADAYRAVDAADDLLEAGMDYAFDENYGYLTACPTNVGTGLRLSCMLHLPALKLVGEMEKVKAAANDMCLAVRGFYGEGSEAVGDLYQISNQTALGKTETQLLNSLQKEIIPRVCDYERVARKNLLSKRRLFIEDHCKRALGVLSHAYLLTTDEAMQLISQVRLGVCLGLIDHVNVDSVSSLFLLVQSAHLQRLTGSGLDQEARKEARATMVRKKLG
jgi:protein arginine kinase